MSDASVYFELRNSVSTIHLEYFLDEIFHEMGKPNISRNVRGYSVYFNHHEDFSIAPFERASRKLRVDLAVVFSVLDDVMIDEYLLRSGKIIKVNTINEDVDSDVSMF